MVLMKLVPFTAGVNRRALVDGARCSDLCGGDVLCTTGIGPLFERRTRWRGRRPEGRAGAELAGLGARSLLEVAEVAAR